MQLASKRAIKQPSRAIWTREMVCFWTKRSVCLMSYKMKMKAHFYLNLHISQCFCFQANLFSITSKHVKSDKTLRLEYNWAFGRCTLAFWILELLKLLRSTSHLAFNTLVCQNFVIFWSKKRSHATSFMIHWQIMV